jgi:hypothetical protein
MANKEIKVGEVGKINGVRVTCLVDDIPTRCCGDHSCHFFLVSCGSGMMCVHKQRKDKTDVYYELVEE